MDNARAVKARPYLLMASTVKMYRGEDETADVHPDEVENYRGGGWSETKPEATAAVEDEGVAEAVEEAPKKKKGK